MTIKIFIGEIRLPVNPFGDIKITVPGRNKKYELINIGEVTRIRDRGLIELELESIFPKVRYPFAVADPLPPETYINYLNSFYEKKAPIRFIVTGSAAEVNILTSIESLEYEERAGEEGEYYYKLSLREYREYTTKRVVVVTRQAAHRAPAGTTYAVAKERPASASKVPPREHVVQKGDTLWKIARGSLGKGERYREIAALNNIKAPYTIRQGQRLKLPT